MHPTGPHTSAAREPIWPILSPCPTQVDCLPEHASAHAKSFPDWVPGDGQGVQSPRYPARPHRRPQSHPDLNGNDPEFLERFDSEARAISALDHPHICTLYDVGHDNDVAYLVRQLIDGETLADMKLAGLSTRGQRIFGMAKLLVMFEIFGADTEAEAEFDAEAVRSFGFMVR